MWSGVRIMGLKFLNSSGSGFSSDAIICLNYAVDEGATLTNNSWGGGGFSQAPQQASQQAQPGQVAEAQGGAPANFEQFDDDIPF